MSERLEPIEVALPGARVAFTTRAGGVSGGPFRSLNLGILTDDDPAKVLENRQHAISASASIPTLWPWDVRCTAPPVLVWDRPPGRGDLQEADGHVTALPGVAVLVLVADCLPVALAGGGEVAMVHCGWRGLAGGILGEPPWRDSAGLLRLTRAGHRAAC